MTLQNFMKKMLYFMVLLTQTVEIQTLNGRKNEVATLADKKLADKN